MRRWAVTGATGFLGRHFVSECLSAGDVNLTLLTRDAEALGYLPTQNVNVWTGDLLKPETLEGFVRPETTLIHLAYLNHQPDANIEATINLARVVGRSRATRVVHCSTAVVVGFGVNGVVTEDTVPEPRGAYQRTKYAIEQIWRRELPSSIELAIVRPTEILGPGGVGLRSMIRRLLTQSSLINAVYRIVLKSRRFNYVSVHNVVAALRLLASTTVVQKGEVYNISDDDDPNNNYAAVEDIIRSGLNLRAPALPDIGLPRPFLSAAFKFFPACAPPDRIYSTSKISSLGYRKTVNLQSTISDLVAFEASRHRTTTLSNPAR